MLCLDLILAAAKLCSGGRICSLGRGTSGGVSFAIGVGAALVVTVLMQAILLPMVYIIGIDKARYVNIVIWMVPWVVIMLFRDRSLDSEGADNHDAENHSSYCSCSDGGFSLYLSIGI